MLLAHLKKFSYFRKIPRIVFPSLPFFLSVVLIFAVQGRALSHDARQPEQLSLSGFDTPSPAEPAKRVLLYLRDMVEYARLMHRRDVARAYEDAIDLVLVKVYGKLPPYLPPKNSFLPEQPKKAGIPAWQVELRARPLRTIVKRSYRNQAGWKIEYEHLECGHILTAKIGGTGESPARHRRCVECGRKAMANKMPPTKARVAPAASSSEQFQNPDGGGRDEGEVAAGVRAIGKAGAA